MIRYIEQALRPKIIALPWIYRYGGIVKAVTVRRDGVDMVFPVSDDITNQECYELGRYEDLAPNEAVKSVSYLEQIGGSRVTWGGSKGENLVAVESFRFVCWLNLPKLGVSDKLGATRYAAATCRELHGETRATVDGGNVVVKINQSVILPNESRSAFSRYSYAQRDWAFFWPFDFYAIEFTATVELNAACITIPANATPIDCPAL